MQRCEPPTRSPWVPALWTLALVCGWLLVPGAAIHAACQPGEDLLISEFMAHNLNTLVDEDASYEDWIEVYNPCLPVVDLDGWYLTDDTGDLTKWQFPALTLERGQFLLVFASGKDRTDPASQLHTNFKLAGEGGYLALVKPDGLTVAHEFAPSYPPQVVDISYGLPQGFSEFVTTGDPVSYRVPTLADSGIGSLWTGSLWDDSGWAVGSSGLGYTMSGSGGFDVTVFQANVNVSNLATAEGVIADPITQSSVANEMAAVVNYLDTGGAGRFGNDNPFPGFTIGQGANDYVMLATGSIVIPTAGDWTFGVNSDDGFGLELTRDPYVFNISFPGTRGAADTLGVFNIVEPGAYDVRLVSFERGGGSSVEFFAAEGAHGSFNSNFHLVGDTASGGLGLGAIGAQIGTDVRDQMQNVNSSIWSRGEFEVINPASLGLLTLRVAFEDGYVAFLNGTEVASDNAPLPLLWDSASLVDRPVEQAAAFQTVDLTDDLGLLVAGTNVLALHGLNETVSDDDFLILGELNSADATDSSGPKAFFTEPSPAEYNDGGYPGVSGIPFFTHASGTYQDPFSLQIFSIDPTALIRYTTNGTEPTLTNGTDYITPIDVNGAMRIRARVFEDGLAPGPVDTRLFSTLAPDVVDFDSNLPIVIVNTFGSGISSNFHTENLITVIDNESGRAAIVDPAQFEGLSGIKLRGSSSSNFPKKQYAVESWDANYQDLDVSLLGMPPESDWIINGPYSDKSLMRNFLAYQWSNAIGRYAVRTEFVEVFLQTGNGPVDSSDYVGVYVLMEKIKRNPNRVPITKLEPVDNQEPEISGGYMLKKDRLDPGDAGFTTSSGQKLAYVDPKEEEVSAAQAAWIKAYLDAFEAALYGPDFTDPTLGYRPYIDPDSFIDHHILVELTKNIDGYRLSTFMFKDRNAKLQMGPIWDYNLSLGNANYLQGWLPDGWYYDLINNSNYPWYERLFQDPDFALAYADRWYELRRGELTTETLLADIDAHAALLEEGQTRNFERWQILGVYVWPNWFVASTYQEEIDFMKDWLADRLDWMDDQFLAPPVFNHPAGQIPAGFNLTMTSDVGTVYYTLDGSDPRLPDGTLSPTALPYMGPVQIVSTVEINARALDGSAWSALNSGTFEPLPLAFINEVMADNQTVHADELGEYDPWIELYNPFSSTVALDTLYLSDDFGDPFKWQLPVDTRVCSNLWLLIWADGETAQGPLHANFTLSPSGGTLWLHDASGFMLDTLTYPPLAADESYGRRPDGGAEFDYFSFSTPDAANPAVSVPIIVNEYNAVAPGTLLDNGGMDAFWGQVPGNGGDWLELAVIEDHLDLRGWSVKIDDAGGAVSTTLTFTNDALLSDLRSGTLITIGTAAPSDNSYDPVNGDWWIHLRAGAAGDGLYVSDLDFSVSNFDTQITLMDALDAVRAGPIGEGINPINGVGLDEVFKLEEDPGPWTAATSNYAGGSSSTYGAPNSWDSGASGQSFVALRSVVIANCTLDTECDDANPCTDDTCDGGTCSNAPNVAVCDDGNPCTTSDVCSLGQCRGDLVDSCCVSDCECEDGDACTSDLCVANVCTNDAAPTGTMCDDLDPCTVNDACDQGLCLPGTAADCSTLDDDCNAGVCNALDGMCEAQSANESGACDSGDLCLMDESCSLGVCGGGAPVDCSSLDDDCNDGICTAGVGCEFQPANDGLACDDGELCTTGGLCAAGACGAAVDCTGVDDQCNVGVCDSMTGGCTPAPLDDGTACDDADACTMADDCQLGICLGGGPVDCDDSNPCTDDSCDPLGGCLHTPVTDGVVCDDGDLCTESDMCGSGVCGGAPLDCSSLDDVCELGACDPGSGLCESQPANEAGSCDDGDLCTSDDACVAGSCTGSSLDCSAEDGICQVGVCNAGSGVCESQIDPDGTSCDDGDACTELTTCTTGVCGDPTPVDCDDGNSCTVESCDSMTGCSSVADDDQDGNSMPDPCDDGDSCTETDLCSGGVCSGAAVDCSFLDDPCNIGACNAGTGVCEPLNLTTGTPCDDADACTVSDQCDAGLCVSGSAVDCDDANACTVDSCDPSTGCASTPDLGAVCDDANPCTETDACDGAGACMGAILSDGTTCDDLMGCTENDECIGGVCGGSAVDCSGLDGPCSAGICNPIGGACEMQPLNEGLTCESGDLCAIDTVCTGGSCGGGSSVDCSQLDDACNVGVCDPGTGACQLQPRLDGTACEDGDLCSESDSCDAGVCQAGTPVDCSGLDDVCNAGVCNASTGVCEQQVANEGMGCSDGDLCSSGDTCAAGVCGGIPVDCSALDDDCNVGLCSSGSGACILDSVNEAGACDDGNLCTESDTCNAGFCSGFPLDCSSLDDTCNLGACEPTTGACMEQPNNEGGACDDAELCSENDVCASGVCAGGAVDCSAFDDACNLGICNSGDGSCEAQPVNEGGGCADGDACTLSDVCTTGVCQGMPLVCDDSDVCTGDVCVAGLCEYAADGDCALSGVVSYYRDSDISSEPSAKPVPGVEIDVDGDVLADTVTDTAGDYLVPDQVGASFSVSPLPRLGVGGVADANGAITSFDATFAAQFSVEAIALSSLQQVAADVSGNGAVTSFDAALISQLAAQLAEHFFVAQSAGSDWAYYRCDNYVDAIDQDCGTPLFVHDPLSQIETDPFFAVLYGDVTGNWMPQAPLPPAGEASLPAAPTAESRVSVEDLEVARKLSGSRGSQANRERQRQRSTPATLDLRGWGRSLRAGETRKITLRIQDADGIEALDLKFGCDPSDISIVEIRTADLGSTLSMVDHATVGEHAIGLYGLMPLKGDGKLLTITLKAVRDLNGSLPLKLEAEANEGLIPLRVVSPAPVIPRKRQR